MNAAIHSAEEERVQLPWLVAIELLRATCSNLLHCMIPILATCRGADWLFPTHKARLYIYSLSRPGLEKGIVWAKCELRKSATFT